MRHYIVDAFTNEVFCGNPAAVCVMDAWPCETWMQRVAAENRLSETAFLVREGEGWRLRWFTPGTEVELCGHASRPRPGPVHRCSSRPQRPAA